MKTLHLFAGSGGGLLADLILGHEPIAAVEWDPYCCAVLRERAEDGWFPGLRVIEGDIREFDASEYAGRVGLVHAGFPCQPFSVAGKQLGADDPRDMWPATLSVIRVVRPEWIMLENVPGLVAWNDGERVADIIGELASLGYVGSHGVLGADDAGAAHIRKRWWCVAHAKGRGVVGQVDATRASLGCGSDVADSDTGLRSGRANVERREAQRGVAAVGSGEAMGNPDSTPENARPAQGGSRRATGESGRRIPQSRLGRVADGLATAMDPPNWWLEEPEGVPRVAQGVEARVHRLKALGNGQVPLQAALAWTILSRGIAA